MASWRRPVLFIIGFAIIGSILLIISHAATPSNTSQTGTLANSTCAGTDVPDAPQNVSINQPATNSTTLQVRWAPSCRSAFYQVKVYTAQSVLVGIVVCGTGDCTSKNLYGLPPGPYWVAVFGGNSTGLSPPSSGSRAGILSVAPCAAGATLCATVDTGGSAGAITHVGSGFLHGLDWYTNTPVQQAVHPKWWRITVNTTHYDRARAAGARTVMLLSDEWWAYSYDTNRKGATPPWQDWTRYRQFIRDKVAAFIATGRKPDYWEVQNEPGNPNYFGAGYESDWSQANILEQFKVAYQEIRAIDPSAKVAGPSLFDYLSYPGVPVAYVDLDTFLKFCADNNIDLGAVIWHELTADPYPSVTQFNPWPTKLVDRVADVRARLAAYGLRTRDILINEYDGPQTQYSPAWNVGQLAALEAANVTGASRACWPTTWPDGTPVSDCIPASLDSLLQSDAKTPRAPYWIYKTYAEMMGNRLPVASSDATLSVLSTRESNGIIKTLVGRHVIANGSSATLYWSGWVNNVPPAIPTALKLTGLSAQYYAVTVQRFDNNTTAAAPATVQSTTVAVSGAAISVSLPNVADGEAYFVSATPAAAPASLPPPTNSGSSSSPSSPTTQSNNGAPLPQIINSSSPASPQAGAIVVATDKGTKVFLDGHAVTGKVDTTTLSNGWHTLTVITKNPDGSTSTTTKKIYVSNKLNPFEKVRNFLFKHWGGSSGRLLNAILALIGFTYITLPPLLVWFIKLRHTFHLLPLYLLKK